MLISSFVRAYALHNLQSVMFHFFYLIKKTCLTWVAANWFTTCKCYIKLCSVPVISAFCRHLVKPVIHEEFILLVTSLFVYRTVSFTRASTMSFRCPTPMHLYFVLIVSCSFLLTHNTTFCHGG